jgi:hypothetical protein
MTLQTWLTFFFSSFAASKKKISRTWQFVDASRQKRI